MFKYVKYTKVETADTVLEFRGQDDKVEVNHFSDNDVVGVSVVSLKGTSADIDALVTQQATEIGCTEITQDEFKTLVADSAQLNRIRQVVKEHIALKYDSADEIAMSKRAVDDVKRVAYESYVTECLAVGYVLKAEIGY